RDLEEDPDEFLQRGADDQGRRRAANAHPRQAPARALVADPARSDPLEYLAEEVGAIHESPGAPFRRRPLSPFPGQPLRWPQTRSRTTRLVPAHIGRATHA